MNATIVLLSFNGAAVLADCLASLLPLPPEIQLLIIDNGSSDESVTVIRQSIADYERVYLVENPLNRGFSGGVNQGIRLATQAITLPDILLDPAEVIILLNQDTVVQPGWIAALLAPFADPRIGVVGCKILDPLTREVLHLGGVVDLPRGFTHHLTDPAETADPKATVYDVDYATGAGLALRVSLLETIGLFDELFYPAYWEEIDLCYRARKAGFRVVVTTNAELFHHEKKSVEPNIALHRMVNRGRLIFLLKTQAVNVICDEFAPTERTWLHQWAGDWMLRSLQAAYFDALVHLRAILHGRAQYHDQVVSALEAQQLAATLRMLYGTCVELRHGKVKGLTVQA